MLAVIFRLILAFLAFRLIGGALRGIRPKPSQGDRRPRPQAKTDAGKSPPEKASTYSDLTPYEIEDAEFEDLPRGED